MAEVIKDTSVMKATGKPLAHWFNTIENSKRGNLSHKEIANFLHKECGLTPWWAQEVTVLYEKSIGRRVTGQTQDSGFQVGISKTLPIRKEALWDIITSPKGFALIVGDETDAKNAINQNQTSKTGIEYRITTYEAYSHMRMQWRLPEWMDYSILQVRVIEQRSGNAALTFHQEKMASKKIREEMRQYWKDRFDRLKILANVSLNRESP